MMQYESEFTPIELENRLGQSILVKVTHMAATGRDYIFLAVSGQQASSLVAKNANHFAFQLRERYDLDPRRFELIELRVAGDEPCLWRWRFEWVGFTPLSPKGEVVTSVQQQHKLFSLLSSNESPNLEAVAN